MGSGIWSTSVYDDAARARLRAGRTAFDYSHATTTSVPRSDWRVHASLDPKGVGLRESRDSAEHPNSVAIACLFDHTGSMGDLPIELQKKLPQLLGLILRKGYLEHPQILFGAIGDATCDRAPLQVGQFESDNRMDENLGRILIERGGGGQMTESYELALYFMARHTAIDCWEKRRHKGYLFLTGDEMAYPRVKRDEVRAVIGDGLQADIPVAEIAAEVQRRYEVFYVLPRNASHGGDARVLGFWRKLLGQNVLEVDDAGAVAETIALTVGLFEGALEDLDAATADLRDFGVSADMAAAATRALAKLAGRGGAVARVGTALPGLGDGRGGGRARRL
jgi:hypothetical protein